MNSVYKKNGQIKLNTNYNFGIEGKTDAFLQIESTNNQCSIFFFFPFGLSDLAWKIRIKWKKNKNNTPKISDSILSHKRSYIDYYWIEKDG